jgi:hypothetical protein
MEMFYMDTVSDVCLAQVSDGVGLTKQVRNKNSSSFPLEKVLHPIPFSSSMDLMIFQDHNYLSSQAFPPI